MASITNDEPIDSLLCFDSYHVRSGIFMVSKRLGQVMVPDVEIGSSRQQVS